MVSTSSLSLGGSSKLVTKLARAFMKRMACTALGVVNNACRLGAPSKSALKIASPAASRDSAAFKKVFHDSCAARTIGCSRCSSSKDAVLMPELLMSNPYWFSVVLPAVSPSAVSLGGDKGVAAKPSAAAKSAGSSGIAAIAGFSAALLFAFGLAAAALGLCACEGGGESSATSRPRTWSKKADARELLLLEHMENAASSTSSPRGSGR
mmetsp:Transcript_153184/g.293351  ORF Transcript_153184/g.293351 Transcript_153184/m.293351 type:complete len:209 (-) Transcript_153184:492-1118(-)